MKLEAKQIKKIIAGFINIPSITLSAGISNKIISSNLISVLATAGFNSTSVPNVRSSSESSPGLIVSGSNNENIVVIDNVTGGKILNIDQAIFGKLTWNNTDYILSFYYLNNSGNIIPYILTQNYTVTLKIPYRFQFDQLPTDVIIKLKQWWLEEKGNSYSGAGSMSSWEEDISTIEALTTHTSGSDIGCYENKSIYEYDATSTATPDSNFVLKPNDISLVDPGRWIKKITINETFYTNNNPSTASNLEGISPGTTFNEKSNEEMWTMLLYPYKYPSFNSFSLDHYSLLEVGQVIPTGNKTFSWTTVNPENINVNSISIEGPGFVAVSGLVNDGQQTVNFTSPVTKTTPGSLVWVITGNNNKGESFTKTYSVDWQWSVYYGESTLDELTISGHILNLRASSLATTNKGTYDFLYAEQKYKYFCYPADWEDPSGFKRSDNGLNIPGVVLPQLVSVIKNGITKQYKIWRSYNKMEGAQTIIIY